MNNQETGEMIENQGSDTHNSIQADGRDRVEMNHNDKEFDTETPGAQELQKKCEELEKIAASFQQETNDWQDKFMRLAAESENVKRRQERERQDWVKFSNEGMIRDLLPVLDGLDKAIIGAETHVNEEVRVFLQGVQIIHKQLLDVLEKKGVKAIESVGQTFDPNYHQAIQRIESEEVDKEIVAMEFAKGYVLNERLIRPAIVSVKVPGKQGS